MTPKMKSAGICSALEDYGKLKVVDEFTPLPRDVSPACAGEALANRPVSTSNDASNIDQLTTPALGANEESAAMSDDEKNGLGAVPVLGKALGMAIEKRSKRKMLVDVDYYQTMLDESDLGEEEKRELVLVVAQIIMGFVDLGFEVGPLQEACGKVAEISEEEGDAPEAVLSSDADTLKATFNIHAAE